MSAEVDRIKKLASSDLIVDAVELPTAHRRSGLVTEDVEEALARFDDDGNYAHFIVRVRRTTQPLPSPETEGNQPQLSIDSLVNETLELNEKISTERQVAEYEPEFLVENARLLEENGDLELARNIYQVLVQKGLRIPQGLAGMARTYEKENKLDRAIRCYQEAIAYSSEFSFYQALAAIHIRLGSDEEASKTLSHALGLTGLDDGKKFELHKSLGNCFTRLGDYPKAEHHYRKAYELNSNSDVLQVNVGSLALQKNEMDAAQKHFQRALEINATNDKAISGLGMVYLSKGNLAKAHEMFVASLGLNLNNLGAIYNLVKCAYDLKKFDETAHILKRYIDTNPVNINILYSYAGILYHLGNLTGASAEVERILASNPNHSGAKELKELIQTKKV
ncbi:MAG: tetratricopeptide repeat protein [Bdellovibrionota bacterium]